MTFKVLIHPKVFEKVPVDHRDQIREALRELKDPLPEGNKKEVKGSHKTVYRLHVGDFRILYEIDFERSEVLVFNIITAEQAHKKYNRFK
ncbi:type II toxin-antitoxin system RelE/ParE family toxin [Methanosarcina sp. DH2]|uniref:type II toxin-antitoxin system RelE family toxin n=1 Tax=Methanosarcina sp. DH2 TaxID=2605639 RepID=UPI001E638658|nr:type II toxin-antitoxin system RelE/ParE family toxin [Methanosarcina sp. DH2]MCC4771579.1 type II toxin-antitoxin system RelE/ParE family toxin [Methanosarcina sp. DH2]